MSLGQLEQLRTGSTDPVAHASILTNRTQIDHPEEWSETARLLAAIGPEHSEQAVSLLETALAETPNDHQSWATLAFLRKQHFGKFTPEVAEALKRSFETCLLCSKSLLRWRFTFVLDNWNDTDEDLRIASFTGADFLRWYHLDYDYLEQVRLAAIARGIPFDDYRRRIDTPTRPNEIGLDRS